LSGVDLTAHTLDLLEHRRPFCLVTVVNAGDSSGISAGQKLVAEHSGTVTGQIGSPQLSNTLAELAHAQLLNGEIRLVRLNGSGSVLPDRRSRRGEAPLPDEIEVVLEPMPPPDRLLIVGAGHIAQPLARLAHVLGFEVTVIDDRERFANRERFPDATSIVVDQFDKAISEQEITPWTYLVLVTRGHEHDESALQKVVGSPAPYIGMIGSRRRVLVVFDRLRAAGVPEHFLSRIYAPIGIDIGARTAEEIALAILAEIVNVKRKGRSSSLKELLPKTNV
jgi:xanthine dehydrogenase accessory factor